VPERILPVTIALPIRTLHNALQDLKTTVDARASLEDVQTVIDRARRAAEDFERVVPAVEELMRSQGLTRHFAWALKMVKSNRYPDQDADDLLNQDLPALLKRIAPVIPEPDRADALRQALTELEGPQIDFKEDIPPTIRDLAEVFASFGPIGGSVYLGVNNAARIAGLSLSSTEQVDKFELRVRGIADKVDPPVPVHVNWFGVGHAIVAEVRIEPSGEPIHYVEYRPYLRDGSRSRPARPSEVIRAIRNHDRRSQFIADPSTPDFESLLGLLHGEISRNLKLTGRSAGHLEREHLDEVVRRAERTGRLSAGSDLLDSLYVLRQKVQDQDSLKDYPSPTIENQYRQSFQPAAERALTEIEGFLE